MNRTNKYLKSSIGEIANFFMNNTEPPEDMYLNMLLELRVSSLLMPISFDGENFSFPHIEVDDGTRLLPLFTSDEELRMYSDEFDSIANEIPYYIKIVREFGFDGLLIDLGSDEFCIERPLLEKMRIPDDSPKGKGLGAEELRQIALTEKNLPLKAFIANEANFNKFDELSALLRQACLLNVVVSEEDLSVDANDGIIERDDSSAFILYTHQSGRDWYGTVYTDAVAAASFHETQEYHYYLQVTNKYRVFTYLLEGDMDGIIINPGTDDYYVPRQVILHLLDEDLIDLDLENATGYAFTLER